MSKYTGVQKEETLKGLVHDDYFSNFGYEPNIDNIDFVVTDAKTRGDLFATEGAGASIHYLWAEAKKGVQDVQSMFAQLILTCKKTYDKAEYSAPPFLACFDTEKIAFAPFYDILPIFKENDINWNCTPSNHESGDFIKVRNKVTKLLLSHLVVFQFDIDEKEIKSFIKTNFTKNTNAGTSVKSPITKDNFVQVFIKWVKEVKSSINISKNEWQEFKENGILDGDFFRADMMSSGGNTITEKLKIILANDNYKLREKINGRLFLSDIGFTDEGAAYKRFWNKYERPPAEIFQKYIIDRRDLLVPVNIREVKGTFFTPRIWADKSKEYIAKVFGTNWQDKYYVWDCAAGTGNLLAGLTNEYNVWASDIDQGNIETIQSLIDIDDNLNLLPSHVFQFDFLNDYIEKPYDEKNWIDKLPPELRRIIDDPQERKKLIIYINPPYAEASTVTEATGTGHGKIGVASSHKTRDKYQPLIGAATNELFAQFMARIYHEIPACKMALFSKLKFATGLNFVKFRTFFKADFKAGFIVHADTFDNVRGKFPIGFTVWDLDAKRFPQSIRLDIPEKGGKKTFWSFSGKSINQWVKQFNNNVVNGIGYMANSGPDFQHINQPYITTTKGNRHFHYYVFNSNNIFYGCVYFAVRLCIEQTWLNDRDIFLYPNDGWKTDAEFQNNCLVFTLFHGQNRISAIDGGVVCANHWIPFTEKQVAAKDKFESNFMSSFLKDKALSIEAQSVYNAGLALWKYYHKVTKDNRTVSVNASFYDIRAFFQGNGENGKMNNKSADETYTRILGALREALKMLTQKIQPKVFEYGFLKE